jgi:hypothetical protein
MLPSGRLLISAVIAASLAPAPALATTPSKTTPAKAHKTSTLERELLHSHALWATIDVCDPADQPSTVGVRGSMPGDGHPHDTMYMSFRLQYLDSATKSWINLSSGASSSFVAVGSGASARQGGTSFALKPVAGKPAVKLRGVVDFQWRRGKTIVVSDAEPTAAGHLSLAGADPANYSAATCVIG